MANLRELISKGTEESLKKLTDEQLGEEQMKAFQRFVIVSVQQAALNQEQKRRGLVDNEKAIREYIRWCGEQVQADDDLFSLKKEGS